MQKRTSCCLSQFNEFSVFNWRKGRQFCIEANRKTIYPARTPSDTSERRSVPLHILCL